MNGQALFGASAIPLIVGLIQVAKYSGLPSKLAPLFALTLGTAAGVISVWQTVPAGAQVAWAAGAVLGITWGLGAAGLYEVGKTAGQALTTEPNPYGPPSPLHQQGQPLGPLPKKP